MSQLCYWGTLDVKEILNLSNPDRQSPVYRSPVWFPERGLPDGRHRAESLPAGFLRDESLHRLDSPHGGQPGLAALRGEVPAGAGGRTGDHHLSRLYPRDHQTQHEGRLWILPTGRWLSDFFLVIHEEEEL